ncbi:MAG: WYL domain-containing protein [Eubacteriales bacterium]|nr:WYL domain-containing protein [Eubacteriales bacterium]
MDRSIKRLDRLTGILIRLQTGSLVSAKQLAEDFGTCVRTIYRDIRSLEAAGVPIGADPGKGFYIVEGYRLPPVSLSKEEAGALLLALKLAEQQTGSDMAPLLRTAQAKICAVLAKDVKLHVASIDPKITVCTSFGQPCQERFSMQTIQEALSRNRLLEIRYSPNPACEPTHRIIEPLYLGFFENSWHLLAYCRLREAYRDFRLDRIQSLRILSDSITRNHPPIAEILMNAVDRKNLEYVRVRLKKDAGCERLKSHFPSGSIEETDLGGGTVELRIPTDSADVLNDWLKRFCSGIEFPINGQ